MCQQSLPSQYDPTSDSSTATSTQSTFYLYPDFFSTAQCTGSIVNIEYQFCYLYTQTMGRPGTVFTALILSDEGSVYRILHSYTEIEDRNLCPTMSNTCCKTVSRVVSLNIQNDLALGFVTPAGSESDGNALYQSGATSAGFIVSGTIVQNTAIDSTISGENFEGVRAQINNQRFSVSFAIDSSTTTTTLAHPTLETTGNTAVGQRQLEWTCSSSTPGPNYFPNVPIDSSSVANAIRGSPYISPTYVYSFQPAISGSCKGKTHVEFCFDNTEDVGNIRIFILFGRLNSDTKQSSTFISGTILDLIEINTTVKCDPDFVSINACCHSERINSSLPTEMNAFGVIFPNQTQILLEYNDSQHQVQTFVATNADATGLTSRGQLMFESSGFTTVLNLRVLRFVVSGEITSPASNLEMLNITAVVSLVIFLVTVILITALIIVIVILCIIHQRHKQKEERSKDTITMDQLATVQEDISNKYSGLLITISNLLIAGIYAEIASNMEQSFRDREASVIANDFVCIFFLVLHCMIDKW